MQFSISHDSWTTVPSFFYCHLMSAAHLWTGTVVVASALSCLITRHDDVLVAIVTDRHNIALPARRGLWSAVIVDAPRTRQVACCCSTVQMSGLVIPCWNVITARDVCSWQVVYRVSSPLRKYTERYYFIILTFQFMCRLLRFSLSTVSITGCLQSCGLSSTFTVMQ